MTSVKPHTSHYIKEPQESSVHVEPRRKKNEFLQTHLIVNGEFVAQLRNYNLVSLAGDCSFWQLSIPNRLFAESFILQKHTNSFVYFVLFESMTCLTFVLSTLSSWNVLRIIIDVTSGCTVARTIMRGRRFWRWYFPGGILLSTSEHYLNFIFYRKKLWLEIGRQDLWQSDKVCR